MRISRQSSTVHDWFKTMPCNKASRFQKSATTEGMFRVRTPQPLSGNTRHLVVLRSIQPSPFETRSNIAKPSRYTTASHTKVCSADLFLSIHGYMRGLTLRIREFASTRRVCRSLENMPQVASLLARGISRAATNDSVTLPDGHFLTT